MAQTRHSTTPNHTTSRTRRPREPRQPTSSAPKDQGRASTPQKRKRKSLKKHKKREEDELWEAEIIGESDHQYLIRWLGNDPNGNPWEPSWQPKGNATGALVKDWEERGKPEVVGSKPSLGTEQPAARSPSNSGLGSEYDLVGLADTESRPLKKLKGRGGKAIVPEQEQESAATLSPQTQGIVSSLGDLDSKKLAPGDFGSYGLEEAGATLASLKQSQEEIPGFPKSQWSLDAEQTLRGPEVIASQRDTFQQQDYSGPQESSPIDSKIPQESAESIYSTGRESSDRKQIVARRVTESAEPAHNFRQTVTQDSQARLGSPNHTPFSEDRRKSTVTTSEDIRSLLPAVIEAFPERSASEELSIGQSSTSVEEPSIVEEDYLPTEETSNTDITAPKANITKDKPESALPADEDYSESRIVSSRRTAGSPWTPPPTESEGRSRKRSPGFAIDTVAQKRKSVAEDSVYSSVEIPGGEAVVPPGPGDRAGRSSSRTVKASASPNTDAGSFANTQSYPGKPRQDFSPGQPDYRSNNITLPPIFPPPGDSELRYRSQSHDQGTGSLSPVRSLSERAVDRPSNSIVGRSIDALEGEGFGKFSTPKLEDPRTSRGPEKHKLGYILDPASSNNPGTSKAASLSSERRNREWLGSSQVFGQSHPIVTQAEPFDRFKTYGPALDEVGAVEGRKGKVSRSTTSSTEEEEHSPRDQKVDQVLEPSPSVGSVHQELTRNRQAGLLSLALQPLQTDNRGLGDSPSSSPDLWAQSPSSRSSSSNAPLRVDTFSAMLESGRSARGKPEGDVGSDMPIAPKGVSRLLMSSTPNSTRSSSVIPANVADETRRPEPAIQPSGLAPVLPVERTSEDSELNITQMQAEEGYGSILDMPRLGPREYVIPLQADARLADYYSRCLEKNAELINQFLKGSVSEDDPLVEKAESVVEELHNVLLHVDLINPLATSSKASPADEAGWASDTSVKFRFLEHFLCRETFKQSDLQPAILAEPGRILELLTTFFEGKQINHRPSATSPARTYEWMPNCVTIYSTAEQIHHDPNRRVDFIICLDNSIDLRSSNIQALRMVDPNRPDALIPVISLIVPNSIEHIERCLPLSTDPAKKLRLSLSCAKQLIGQVKHVKESSIDPDEAAEHLMGLCCMEDGKFTGLAAWDFPPLVDIRDVVELYSSSDERSEEFFTISSAALKGAPNLVISRKRALDSPDNDIGKKMRMTPQSAPALATATAEEKSTTQTTEPHALASITKELRDDYESRLSAANGAFKEALAEKDRTLRQHKKALDRLQTRYEEQTAEMRKLRRDLEATEKLRDNYQSRSQRGDESIRAKGQEINELKEQLKEARELAKGSSDPAVVNLTALLEERDELATKCKKLEAGAKRMDDDLEFFRKQYQERDNQLRESTNRVAELEEEKSRLETKAQEVRITLQEKNIENQSTKLVEKIKRLEIEKQSLQGLVHKLSMDLEKARNQRIGVGTRANSVPRSPRLGTRGPGSRAGSPMTGAMGSRVGVLRGGLEGR